MGEAAEKAPRGHAARCHGYVLAGLVVLGLASDSRAGTIIGDEVFCSLQRASEFTVDGVVDNWFDPQESPAGGNAIYTNPSQPHVTAGAGVECGFATSSDVVRADLYEALGQTFVDLETTGIGTATLRFSGLDFGDETITGIQIVFNPDNVAYSTGILQGGLAAWGPGFFVTGQTLQIPCPFDEECEPLLLRTVFQIITEPTGGEPPLDPSPVPEPGLAILLGAGVGAAIGQRLLRRSTTAGQTRVAEATRPGA